MNETHPDGSPVGFGQNLTAAGHDVSLAFYIFLGYKAAKAHYRYTGNWATAMLAGVGAAVRWKWLAMTFLMWLIFVGFSASMYFDDEAGLRGAILGVGSYLLVAPFCLGITYNRAVDASLFKRRFLYRIIAPLDRRFDRTHWGWMYASVFLPFTFWVLLGGLLEASMR